MDPDEETWDRYGTWNFVFVLSLYMEQDIFFLYRGRIQCVQRCNAKVISSI